MEEEGKYLICIDDSNGYFPEGWVKNENIFDLKTTTVIKYARRYTKREAEYVGRIFARHGMSYYAFPEPTTWY